MSGGSILVGLALSLVVIAYLARPFRPAQARADLDRAIEVWLARLEVERPAAPQEEAERADFCPQCGRRAGPDDRFCAGCGRPLPGGAA
jgi:hypothetical protein